MTRDLTVVRQKFDNLGSSVVVQILSWCSLTPTENLRGNLVAFDYKGISHKTLRTISNLGINCVIGGGNLRSIRNICLL